MATCNRGCCFWLFFSISMLVLSGYLFYCGWWLPIQINNHRLRYNQLTDFEIYTVDKTDWFKYNMDTEHITIISYAQHKPYNYKYFIGSPITDSTLLSFLPDNSTLINSSWNEFSDSIKINDNNSLYIIQYSESKCDDFQSCFQNYINNNLDYSAWNELNAFRYTSINSEYKATINSELSSKILDNTRDGFQFLIMLVLCVWFVVVLEFFDDNEQDICEGWSYLFITIFIGMCYLLWIFALSFIPILFSTPAGNKQFDYWQEIRVSLTYTVGEFFPPWWIAGVIMHGIWQWCLIVTCPLCCGVYIVALMFCCCNDKRADKLGKIIVIPLITVALIGIIFGTVGFIPLFIGNMSMYNNNTYNNMNDIGNDMNNGYNDASVIMLQLAIAIGLVIIIVPIFACILTLITKCIERDRGELRAMHSVKNSVRKLPVIGSNRKLKDGDPDYDKVEMGKDETNYDVYT